MTYLQLGWICPKCGRVYSPYVNECIYCRQYIPGYRGDDYPKITCLGEDKR